MAKVYLISVQAIRQETGLSDRAEDHKILPAILMAQEELAKCIGLTGYRELIEKVDLDNELASEGDWRYLMCEYIKPWLAWKSYEYALPFFQASVSQNGIKTIGSDNGFEKANKWEVSGIADFCRARANNILEAFNLYLKENETDFAWYGETVNEDRPHGSMRAGGIRLYKECGCKKSFECKC